MGIDKVIDLTSGRDLWARTSWSIQRQETAAWAHPVLLLQGFLQHHHLDNEDTQQERSMKIFFFTKCP